jgi:hypothetical protein
MHKYIIAAERGNGLCNAGIAFAGKVVRKWSIPSLWYSDQYVIWKILVQETDVLFVKSILDIYIYICSFKWHFA